MLRACQPGVKDFELKEAYENNFLSELRRARKNGDYSLEALGKS